jgi:6-phosphogluconolactonase
VDVGNASLTRQGSVTVPARIQYVCRNTVAHTLFVASSNFVLMGDLDWKHHISAFRINSIIGALTVFAQPVALRARPIHITVDHHADFLLTAYNLPGTLTVHRIQQSSSIGEEAKQAAPIDCGVFAHQIRMLPSHHELVLVTRGNNKTDTKPEDPAAPKVKAFHDGQVTSPP